MKAGKAPGPSGIVVEMIRAACDMGASMIRGFSAAIIRDGKVPSDWEQSFIVCLYKGKEDALERGNKRGLKLTEQVMKILERIVDGLIRQLVSVNDSQFGFVPGRGTTDAIFVVRQLQEKYLAANKRLHGFHRPGEGIWLSTSEGHLVGAEKTRCGGVDCATSAGDVCKCAEPCPRWWGVQWRVWSESWCSPRISTQLAALPSLCLKPYHLFRSGVPWEDLYELWPCYHRWIAWGMCKEALDLERSNGEKRTESKWWKDIDHDLRYGPGPPAEFNEFPCAVCHTGVGSNSIFFNGCKHWVHKKCSGLKHLTKDPDYRCTRCWGTARPLDGRPQKEVQVWPDKLEVVTSFCYLGDMLSAAGGCELSTTTCVKTAWKKFKDLLPVLSSRHLSFKARGRVYSSDMRNAPMVQSRQPLTYRLMESVGLGGPRWMEAADREGLQRLEALGYQPSWQTYLVLVWDLPCVQQTSYLEGGPLIWMLPVYLNINQKSDYDMMMTNLCLAQVVLYLFLLWNLPWNIFVLCLPGPNLNNEFVILQSFCRAFA